MVLRRPFAPAFCLFRKTITSEAASSVGGLIHFKPSVRCLLLALSRQTNSAVEWSLLGEMALLNLTVNARDAMPDGGEIIVAARQEIVTADHSTGLKSGLYVCLSVVDTGEGMDALTLRKAVEPFFTTKGIGKGTGLGLSMVHGFAEQSGGRFILQSQQGKGTTAELWLPAAEASAQTVGAIHSGQETPAKTFPSRTVLAVDDDALILMNTVAMLEDLGHTVFEAYSGKEAWHSAPPLASFDLQIEGQSNDLILLLGRYTDGKVEVIRPIPADAGELDTIIERRIFNGDKDIISFVQRAHRSDTRNASPFWIMLLRSSREFEHRMIRAALLSAGHAKMLRGPISASGQS